MSETLDTTCAPLQALPTFSDDETSLSVASSLETLPFVDMLSPIRTTVYYTQSGTCTSPTVLPAAYAAGCQYGSARHNRYDSNKYSTR